MLCRAYGLPAHFRAPTTPVLPLDRRIAAAESFAKATGADKGVKRAMITLTLNVAAEVRAQRISPLREISPDRASPRLRMRCELAGLKLKSAGDSLVNDWRSAYLRYYRDS